MMEPWHVDKRPARRWEKLEGKRVRLISMDDPQAPPAGTEGTVEFVDDMGTIFVRWDTGSGLGLIPGKDQWEVIK